MIFSQERLPNGTQLAVAHMPHVESVSVGFWIGVGGRQESRRQNGVFHFLEHMLFKGTTKRNAREISEAIEGVGGYLNAFTAEEMTCYYARASASHLPLMVDVLSDMLLRATFPAAEIARERGVIQEEIRMYEDQPGQVAQDIASTLLWPNHPLGQPLLGTSDTVNRLRRRDLLNVRRKYYHAGNLCITVAGKTDIAEVKELLKPLLRQLPTGPRAMAKPVSRRQSEARVQVVRKPIEQTQFVVGLRGVSRHDPRRSAFRLMSVMLGENMSSRLFQNVREKQGLVYSIFSELNPYRDTGCLAVYAGTSKESAPKVVQSVLKEFRDLKEVPVSTDELVRAKAQLKGSLMLSLESSMARMSNLARQEMY